MDDNQSKASERRKHTSQEIRGSWKIDNPPNDTEVKQIIEEARWERFLRKSGIVTEDEQPTPGSLQEALGIIAIPNPPDDEEVKQWLDEHKMEKYG